MITYILIVIMNVNNGHSIQFQEFNTLAKCEYNAKIIKASSSGVVQIYCAEK